MSETKAESKEKPVPPAHPAGKARDALAALEYPRHVHKAGGAYLRVEDAAEARAALSEGWVVDANDVTAPTHGT